MSRLRDKIVFITGATAGIGRASAFAFAAEGAKVIITGRRVERLQQVEEEINRSFGTAVLSLKLDVKNVEEVRTVVENLPAEWKNVDILLNNAGIGLTLDKMFEAKTENWDEMIDTNVKGLLYVTRTILPGMIARKQGHIINLGSIAGDEVYPGGNIYCATKYAVKAITDAIRIECLDKKIKVTTIDPGMVETDFSLIRFNGDAERAKNVYKGIDALTSEDIADAIIWAASRPYHVNINRISMTPIQQASTHFVVRDEA